MERNVKRKGRLFEIRIEHFYLVNLKRIQDYFKTLLDVMSISFLFSYYNETMMLPKQGTIIAFLNSDIVLY